MLNTVFLVFKAAMEEFIVIFETATDFFMFDETFAVNLVLGIFRLNSFFTTAELTTPFEMFTSIVPFRFFGFIPSVFI